MTLALDKSIIVDMIQEELGWAIKSTKSEHVQYHMERSLVWFERLVEVFAEEYGEDLDVSVS